MGFEPRWLGDVLIAFGLILGGLLAEAGSRVYLALEERQRIRDWDELRRGRVRASDGVLNLGQIVRLSDDPRVIYELIPGLRDKTFRGHPLAIVGIVDSVMFGWGLPEAHSFPRQLERMLREGEPPVRAEVINLAVPGYNTAMEVAALERVGLGYQPDLVLLHFYENDLELPNFIAERPRDLLDPTQSFLLGDLLARWVSGTDPPSAIPGIARTRRGMRLASGKDPGLTASRPIVGYRRFSRRSAPSWASRYS